MCYFVALGFIGALSTLYAVFHGPAMTQSSPISDDLVRLTPHERADAFMEEHPILIIVLTSTIIAAAVSLGFLGVYQVFLAPQRPSTEDKKIV